MVFKKFLNLFSLVTFFLIFISLKSSARESDPLNNIYNLIVPKLPASKEEMSPSIDTYSASLYESMIRERRQNCLEALRGKGSFENRILGCPLLADQIMWQEPGGSPPIPFVEWPRNKKDRINVIFERIMNNEANLGLNCPVPRVGVNIDEGDFSIYMSADEAFDVYAAHILHSIKLEIDGELGWSLFDIPAEELKVILNSSEYHSPVLPADGSSNVVRRRFSLTGFQRPAWEYASNILVCDPRIPYNFLRGSYNSTRSNLIGETPESTLENITWWFHKNTFHANEVRRLSFSNQYGNQASWIREKITFQNRMSLVPYDCGRRWSCYGVEMDQGCHSASILLLDLTRVINIPIRNIFHFNGIPQGPIANLSEAHQGVIFRWSRPNALYLIHADDIFVQERRNFPINEDGSRMSENQYKRLFFNLNWVSPETVRNWGFYVYRPVLKMIPGHDRLGNGNTLGIGRQDIGYLGGYQEVYSRFNNYNIGTSAWHAEKSYQLCSWDIFLSTYCNQGDEAHHNLFGQVYNSNVEAQSASRPLPPLTTPEDAIERADRCVNAYGGCEELSNRANQLNQTSAQTYLVLP